MLGLRRAARVFADEGLAGLVRRTGRKLTGPRRVVPPPPPAPVEDSGAALARDVARAKAVYDRQAAAFRDRTRGLAVPGLEHFYWYHTVDLGGGLVTPGDYDFRDQLGAFGFPADMTGLRVLDVGSATGFFAFEFARRGAAVTSVELPSLAAWDMVSAEREKLLRGLQAEHQADTPEEAYRRHLDGPFQFCQARLGLNVTRCYSSVYDLTLAKVGGEKFDLVYAGDILMHLFSPFRALDVLSGLCRGSLVTTIETPFPFHDDQPLILFRGLINGEEGRTWWMPSRGGVSQMLRRLGFASVEAVGSYSGVARRAWFPYTRDVIRATRA